MSTLETRSALVKGDAFWIRNTTLRDLFMIAESRPGVTSVERDADEFVYNGPKNQLRTATFSLKLVAPGQCIRYWEVAPTNAAERSVAKQKQVRAAAVDASIEFHDRASMLLTGLSLTNSRLMHNYMMRGLDIETSKLEAAVLEAIKAGHRTPLEISKAITAEYHDTLVASIRLFRRSAIKASTPATLVGPRWMLEADYV